MSELKFERHVGNIQPGATIGKKVVYRTIKSDFIHHEFFADYMNWRTTGEGRATLGAISEYAVVE